MHSRGAYDTQVKPACASEFTKGSAGKMQECAVGLVLARFKMELN
jgi:hypothetical protein